MGVYLGGPTIEVLFDTQGPAPDGFHVPLSSEWTAVKTVWTALGGGSSDGTNFGIALKLPFAGRRNRSSADVINQGTYGYYWSSSRYDAIYAYNLNFNSTALNPQNNSSRAGGFSVRCFKNSPVIPTSSWTKLYGTSIESGGIFWSSADGLISLSSDGQTWITIQDKNLGATTVWNSGDTLSEANAGKYYQRGNNYGFAWTGTVTTSSTRVDASNYGPGNYYSSSTFIIYNGAWDTTDNGNLWGGVSQGTSTKTIYPDLKNAYIGEYDTPPSEYQKVEYIQSSGTQYINTLVNPTSSTKVQTKIMATGTSANGGPIYGVFYNFASNTRFCGWYENGGVWFGYGGNNGGNNIVQVGMNTDITIEQYTSGGVSHNIVNGTDNSYSGASFTAQNYPMFLFARNNSTSDIDRRLYLKMYYFKIYSGDTLTKYFVPCYRKSDNVIGMYDLVNDVFYTNSGTGTFTKGPDVN